MKFLNWPIWSIHQDRSIPVYLLNWRLFNSVICSSERCGVKGRSKNTVVSAFWINYPLFARLELDAYRRCGDGPPPMDVHHAIFILLPSAHFNFYHLPLSRHFSFHFLKRMPKKKKKYDSFYMPVIKQLDKMAKIIITVNLK